MLGLASVLLLAQVRMPEPPTPRPGCASLLRALEARVALDDGGFARAKDACYEQLALGVPLDDISRAMREYAGMVLSAPSADPGGPAAGDGWLGFLPARPDETAPSPAPARAPGMRPPRMQERIPMVEVHYWGSCDERGPHGACDQMGMATFRVAPEYWAQFRFFDYYADSNTAGAAGLGAELERDRLDLSAGLWIGTWASRCVNNTCDKGAEFVAPWLDLRLGPPAFYVDAGVGDGRYVSSGHARLEVGHAFENGSRFEGGVTAGVLGRGAAARGDARIVLWGHVAVDLYASAGAHSLAVGAGAGIRY